MRAKRTNKAWKSRSRTWPRGLCCWWWCWCCCGVGAAEAPPPGCSAGTPLGTVCAGVAWYRSCPPEVEGAGSLSGTAPEEGSPPSAISLTQNRRRAAKPGTHKMGQITLTQLSNIFVGSSRASSLSSLLSSFLPSSDSILLPFRQLSERSAGCSYADLLASLGKAFLTKM